MHTIYHAGTYIIYLYLVRFTAMYHYRLDEFEITTQNN